MPDTMIERPEPQRLAEGCQHGCGYVLPCPGKVSCVHWERSQYVGPTRYAFDAALAEEG